MVIGALKVQMRINGARSLKEKRKVLKSIKDRVKQMNISIAEVDDQDKWQAATIGLAVVSNDAVHINSMMDKVMNVFYSNGDLEILNSQFEIVHV
ncbi:MAG: DUF503 domain-containing protein [Deltaproteobacteria bacterium]|nr:DUF503 domain-containing protein [Deltaproteobacteria bacterium]